MSATVTSTRPFRRRYSYDAAGQLVAVEDDAGWRIEYEYDPNGNRLRHTVTAAALEVPRNAPTSEQTPGSEQTPAAPSQSATVRTRVEVLSPDGSADQIGSLEPGATCVVESTSGGWALVHATDGSIRGWVDAAALDTAAQVRP
jgi:YD repeat-containing protein